MNDFLIFYAPFIVVILAVFTAFVVETKTKTY